ncbi:ROK family transcriptional regulator [Kitasatospora terrestris]|uniref:ROK family transcriptional regulator n=1 Tax=Kitasatospora terrestris TaxID=258051 RepID=A0ABP9DB15_9ACTN
MTSAAGPGRAAPVGPARQRAANRAVLLRTLRLGGPTTRQELASRSGLSLTTVAGLVTELEPTGLVVQHTVAHPRSGRRPFVVAFNPGAGAALAVDLGRTRLAVAVGDRTRPVLAERTVPRPPEDPQRLVGLLAEQVLAEAGTAPETLVGAAVAAGRRGVPGGSDDGGRLLPGRPAPSEAAALARGIERTWQLPVTVESRARLGALAEVVHGAVRAPGPLLNLVRDEGTELGIAIGGTLYSGGSGGAGRIGHVVVDPGGRPCECGRRGCLDASVDEDALRRSLHPGPVPGGVDAVGLLARAVGAAAVLIDPSTVVLGGSLASLGEGLAQRLRAELAAAPGPAPGPVVVCSALGERAVLLGALDLVLSSFGQPGRPADQG